MNKEATINDCTKISLKLVVGIVSLSILITGSYFAVHYRLSTVEKAVTEIKASVASIDEQLNSHTNVVIK